MNCLAFDLGASSGKLFLGKYDGNRLSLETVHRFEHSALSLGDGLYWDFLNIWRNLCQGIQQASHQTGQTFASLGIDTYCNDFSFIGKDGGLLAPMRCYRDERTIRCSDAIYQKMSPWQLYQASGNQIASFNTLMQLAAMREEGTDAILQDAHKLLFLPDLLAYYITGETVAERTVSSVSQMYDFAQNDWSQQILKTFNLPVELFAPLTSPGTVSGSAQKKFRESWGTGDFQFVSVCQHDTASAFLASACGDNSAMISSGTWALVGCESENPIINEFGFAHNIANEGSLPGHHRLVRNVMGSWLLQELRADYGRVGEGYSYSDFEQLAHDAQPFAWLIDVDDPAFFLPGEMRRKIRQKCLDSYGTAPNSPGEFARCICESLALKYRWAVEKLEMLTGKSLPVVSVIGGGSKDRLTCQFTANACARPVLAGPADASALGNILVQLLAQGELSSIAQGRELVKHCFPVEEFSPCDTALWEDAYGDFLLRYGLV